MKGQQPAAIGCAQRVTALHLDHEQSDVGFHDEIHLDASRGTPGGEASVPLPRAPRREVLRNQPIACGATRALSDGRTAAPMPVSAKYSLGRAAKVLRDGRALNTGSRAIRNIDSSASIR